MNVDRRTPIVSLLLIAANIAAAFLLLWQPSVIDAYGFVPARPSVVAALVSLFLHQNLFHLLGNMLFLAAAGPAAEKAVGSLRFFGVYLACGLAGIAAHWFLAGMPEVPLIGASGAVAGCVALASVRFYGVRVPLAPGFSVPLLAVSAAWLGLQVVGGMVSLTTQTAAVSFWAHVGGAAAGLLLALAFRTQKDAYREASSRRIEEMAERSPAATLAAAEDHLKSHPNDLDALLEKGGSLARLGEREAAAEAFRAAFESAPPARQADVVACVAESDCLEALPASKRAFLAAKLQYGQTDLAARLYESVVRDPQADSLRPDALLALAEIRREANPDEASRFVTELLTAYPLHPAAEIAKSKGWAS